METIESKYDSTPQHKTVKAQEVNTDTYNFIETIETNQIIPIESIKTMVSFSPNNEDLQGTIMSMMERISEGEMNWRCTVCATTTKGRLTQMKRHIESHLEEVSHPCKICGKISRSGAALKLHVTRYHRN